MNDDGVCRAVPGFARVCFEMLFLDYYGFKIYHPVTSKMCTTFYYLNKFVSFLQSYLQFFIFILLILFLSEPHFQKRPMKFKLSGQYNAPVTTCSPSRLWQNQSEARQCTLKKLIA